MQESSSSPRIAVARRGGLIHLRSVAAIGLLAVLSAGSGAAQPDFDRPLREAMAPYYGALLASTRSDAESTQRYLVLFASRWKTAAEKATAAAPAALRDDPEWPRALERITMGIASAQKRVRARDVAGAHTELEGVRLVLHDLRVRHGLATFDDRVTEYHEAMERVFARAATRNEIRLRPDDYSALTADLAQARTLWAAVEAVSGDLSGTAGWTQAVEKTRGALDGVERAVSSRDTVQAAQSAERLKEAYYELLGVLSSR